MTWYWWTHWFWITALIGKPTFLSFKINPLNIKIFQALWPVRPQSHSPTSIIQPQRHSRLPIDNHHQQSTVNRFIFPLLFTSPTRIKTKTTSSMATLTAVNSTVNGKPHRHAFHLSVQLLRQLHAWLLQRNALYRRRQIILQNIS